MLDNPTKKRLFINISLVCGLVLLTFAIWLSPDKTIQKRLFDGLEPIGVTQIRIENSSIGAVTMTQIDEHWEITDPIKITASAFRVASLLNITQEISHSKYALSNIDPVELGFNSSTPSLYLNDFHIQFGDKDPIDGRRYTQFQNKVHLIEDRYLPIINASIESLVDTQILPDHLEITKYQLPDYSILQTENGGWAIHPEDSSIGADQIQEWVNRWRRQRATKVLYKPKLDFHNIQSVTLELKDRASISLDFVNTNNLYGLYWAEKHIVYIMLEDTIESLITSPYDSNHTTK